MRQPSFKQDLWTILAVLGVMMMMVAGMVGFMALAALIGRLVQ